MFRLAPDIAPAATAAVPAGARPGDVLVVEAATAELALTEVSARLGEHAEILNAEKVRRGGVMGFFAQEICRVTVRVPGAAPDEAPDEVSQADVGVPTGVDDALLRLTAAAEAQDGDFAAVLRRSMGGEPAVRAAAVSQVAQAAQVAQLKELLREIPMVDEVTAEVEDAPGRASLVSDADDAALRAPRIGWMRDPAAAAGTGPVGWSAGALDRLGIPVALIEATEGQEPVDDAGWLVAFAAAVAPYCRPLPAGDVVVAGPRADTLAGPLGLPLAEAGDEAVPDGSVCVNLRDTAESLGWLRGLRRTHSLHAVLGGTGWDGLLLEDPLVVSWVGDDWLPFALQHCAVAGTVLGYGTVGVHGQLLRANPVDVALSVRSLLPRR
jgi:hypothetical protein